MILVFSGTGNTLAVAHHLAEHLADSIRRFTADELIRPSEAVITSDDRRIIWMFPTYSWGVPPIILNLIRNARLHFNPDAEHWMVTTAGDDSGEITRQWRKAMRLRNLKTRAAFSVTMPNTYTMMKGFDVDSPEVADKKLRAMPDEAARIAAAITGGSDIDSVVRGSWPRFKTRVIYPWFRRYMITAKGFHTNDECTRCGWCIRNCPLGNISADADLYPRWGDKCTMCERCYHGCPSHAVEWRKATRGKGQYRNFIKLFTNDHSTSEK